MGYTVEVHYARATTTRRTVDTNWYDEVISGNISHAAMRTALDLAVRIANEYELPKPTNIIRALEPGYNDVAVAASDVQDDLFPLAAIVGLAVTAKHPSTWPLEVLLAAAMRARATGGMLYFG
jgi:hypothetical protein